MGAFQRPRSFDRNLIVIGGGSGGLVSAYLAALSGAKVTLIERGEMGGDCLNRGCVPSKAMIRSARMVAELRKAADLGVEVGPEKVDFLRVMERIHQVIESIAPHDSVERYRALGVEVIQGSGTISTPWSVRVNGQELTARKIIIATGAHPHLPPIEGIDQVDVLTSDTLWDIRELPRRLLVIGTGTIGCELAQSFARLGSKVTLVGRAEMVLPNEDPETSKLVLQQFHEDGMEVILHANPERFSIEEEERWVHLRSLAEGEEERRVAFDQVLVATGRVPNLQGLGLEQLGIELNQGSGVALNEQFQSNYPSIALCGDVAGSYQFTHAASNQAKSITLNSLFGFFKRFKVDESVMPWATFTDPEIAQVGLNEQMAKQQGAAYEVTRFDFSDLDRAVVDGEACGWIKVLTKPGSDQILGATIVGDQAGELLQEYVLAMRRGLGLNAILDTIHPYPTRVEINQRVAGKWRQSNAPDWVLRWSRWLLSMQRRGLF